MANPPLSPLPAYRRQVEKGGVGGFWNISGATYEMEFPEDANTMPPEGIMPFWRVSRFLLL